MFNYSRIALVLPPVFRATVDPGSQNEDYLAKWLTLESISFRWRPSVRAI